MMTKSRKEIIERTMSNLRCVDDIKRGQGDEGKESSPHEVTQLVNSFLVTVLQNWDELESGWPHIRQGTVNWPKIQSSEPDQQARHCIGKIRDALAHGCFVFEGDDGDRIKELSRWTCPDRKTVDWNLTLKVEEMRAMLECFAEVALEQPLKQRKALRKGEACGG